MKSLIKISACFFSLLIVLFCFSVAISADESSSVLNLLIESNKTEAEAKITKISYALDVIANSSDMTIAGVTGNMLNFSADRFACAMNLSDIEYITVTSLPDIVCGSLYIGGEGVSVNQRISASDISLMTYEEAPSGKGSQTSFNFRVDDSTYDIKCNIFMIDDLNYSPTVSGASYASLNLNTYKEVMISASLHGYDPEGDELTFEIVKYPTCGILTLDSSDIGTYTYVPNKSYTGADSFRYVVYDKYGNYSASAEVNINVSNIGNATVYSDLTDDGMHSHAISMTEKGIMNGVQVGEYYYFEPSREVSRAEFVVTAMNAIGIKNVPDVEKTGFFDDENISPEMKGYIALAYSKGYISGIKKDGNLYFDPSGTVNLSEASVIISNIIGYKDPVFEPAFADAQKIPQWSQKAIKSLYALGILEVPDKLVSADTIITRGEMAKLLNKTILAMGK